MPSKKKKYNGRFPPARIKKIMQMDEEVGKVAATVPVIISRALELFIESLITQASQTTLSRNAKTLSTSHIKQAIESEEKYHFLRELVASVPDHQTEDDGSSSSHPIPGASGSGDAASMQGNLVKRPRGRPRKPRDATGTIQRKERRKKLKKESSESSASDDSEGTEDAEEEEDSSLEPNGSNSSSTNSMATAGPSIPTMPYDPGMGMRVNHFGALPHPGPSVSSAFPGFPAPSMYPPGMPMYPGLPGGVLNPMATWPPPPPGPQIPGTSHAGPSVAQPISHNQEDDDYDT